jgi:hypothetical protein
MRIKTMDYPGEDFRDGITKDTPQEKIKEFAEHLLKSDIIILLADPNDIPEQVDNSEKRRKIIDSINTHLQAARDVLKTQHATLKYADVCIVVGKFDKLPEFEAVKKAKDNGRDIAKQFFQKHWTNFAKTLSDNTDIPLKQIFYFPVSAVGNTIPSEHSTSRDQDGRAPDKENLAPFGYEGLFHWIADRKERLAWRKRMKRISAVVFFLLILFCVGLVFFSSRIVVDNVAETNQLTMLERQDISVAEKLKNTTPPATNKVTERRNDILDTELERLKTNINATNDSPALYSLRTKLEEIDEVYDGDRNVNIENLLKQISNKIIDNDFQFVKDSFEGNRKTFKDQADAFLKNHLNAPQSDNVREMLKEKETKDTKDERLRIKNIAVSNAGSLQGKRDAIVKFLQEYGGKLTPADKETMQRATDLAKMFCERHSYTITLKQYGGFAYPEDIQGRISIDGNTAGSHQSKGKCQTANPGEKITAYWQCGQSIKLEIKAYAGRLIGGLETVASLSDTSPAALKLLAKRTVLTPVTKSDAGWDWSLPSRKSPDGYFMHCEIKEITDADWKAFETYILPGSGW